MFGERAFLKNLDAFPMLFADSPVSSNVLTCGIQDRGETGPGLRGCGVERSANATLEEAMKQEQRLHVLYGESCERSDRVRW